MVTMTGKGWQPTRGEESTGMTIAEAPATDTGRIKDLVQRYKVCFESYPVWHVPPGGGKVAIGYELDLIGTPDHVQHPPTPGSEDSTPVLQSLLEIAASILPADDREGCTVIEPVEPAIHFSPRRKMRPDIVLIIEIVHGHPFDLPIDAGETRCLREMKEKLKELGARPDQW